MQQMLGHMPNCWLSSRQPERPEHAFYCTLLSTKCLTLKYNITAVLRHISKSMQRTVRLLNKAYVQCNTLKKPSPCYKQAGMRGRTRRLLHSVQAWSV